MMLVKEEGVVGQATSGRKSTTHEALARFKSDRPHRAATFSHVFNNRNGDILPLHSDNIGLFNIEVCLTLTNCYISR